jgi:hypothetical protein
MILKNNKLDGLALTHYSVFHVQSPKSLSQHGFSKSHGQLFFQVIICYTSLKER